MDDRTHLYPHMSGLVKTSLKGLSPLSSTRCRFWMGSKLFDAPSTSPLLNPPLALWRPDDLGLQSAARSLNAIAREATVLHLGRTGANASETVLPIEEVMKGWGLRVKGFA